METVVTPDNLEAFGTLVVKAVADGKWPSVAALGLVASVWALRKFVAPRAPFFATGEGGVVLNLATSFAGALATAIFTGTQFTWGLLWASFQVALLASGGWSLLKHLLPLVVSLFPGLARGNALRVVSDAEKQGLAAAVEAKTPKSEDIANGP